MPDPDRLLIDLSQLTLVLVHGLKRLCYLPIVGNIYSISRVPLSYLALIVVKVIEVILDADLGNRA